MNRFALLVAGLLLGCALAWGIVAISADRPSDAVSDAAKAADRETAALLEETVRARKALERIERKLGSLATRRDVSSLAAGPSRPAVTPPSANSGAQETERAGASDATARPSDTGPPLRAATRKERISELMRNRKSADARRRWFHRTTEDALAFFGVPKSVGGNAQREYWIYETEDEHGRPKNYQLTFIGGRLVQW